jgi:gluconolactonase
MTGNVYRYRIEDGRLSGERETFGNVNDSEYREGGLPGPDGMAFSEDGRLWCTVFGQGDVTVLDRDGNVVERIKMQGRSPTNVAFGLDGEQRIYVVEDATGSMAAFDVDATGLALYD